ncbi:hypothetical protein DSO57_1019355 [Entomophthora muscae]|uniref:Uncharacterized protein n=1 Tax=Entomophthora muscae TaxID=34485 RepID=A0ACC2T437_9FUNG|nr:hypothetical protein DSO57_1019355 [Entomophthora muscae]
MIWLTLVGVSIAHSWLDCIGLPKKYTGPDQFFGGSFFKDYCIGYGRGYPGRFNNEINTIYTALVERRGNPDPATTKVCGSTQLSLNYSAEFPMTEVAAGTTVKLWYQMDGHLVPSTSAHVFSFAKPGKEIVTYNDMLKAKKIMTHVFASPQNCHNTGNPNTWCWDNLNIPASWEPGVYSFLWNWPWDRNPTGEEYNTCFDIKVTSSGSKPKSQTKSPTNSQTKSKLKCRQKPSTYPSK